MKASQTIAFTGRGLPKWVHRALKFSAKKNARSLSGEAVTVLTEFAKTQRDDMCASGEHIYDTPVSFMAGAVRCRCGAVKNASLRREARG